MSRLAPWTGRCWALGAALAVLVAGWAGPADATSWGVPLAGGSAGQAAAGTLASPTGVTATCGGGTTVAVSWTAVPGAATYSIQRSTTSATSGFGTTATGIAGTAWTSPSLSNNSYWFRVVADNGTWSGPASTATSRRRITGGSTCS